MPFADSHCHLDDSQFADDRDSVVQRARAAGVAYMLSIGTGDGPDDLECALRLASQQPFIFATAGVHPNDAAKVKASTFSHLNEVLRHPKVRALGEIGLDYHWDVPKETQMPVFSTQLQMAADLKMPIVIHTRDAWEDTIAVLREQWVPTGLACVMHCFTGTPAQAELCLELGFYLSFGGVATFPKSSAVRESARLVPPDRMLLETDAPYLAPVPYRGKRNEPAFLVHTAETIAQVRGVALEELAAQTTATFKRVFRISDQESDLPDSKLH